ncbi:hypothetical protein [Mesorhizobium sp.]|uniref:hypothetical protein n=1 Tax=Mesorhizobium sp. TaxID=1871066 RepID=UPI00120A60AA|nr:hypothetical protein [Mesorhizobium sp.]TIM37651.1 MAG: hypothetical protein E5Y56_32895 [Mesorhizobium sp.]
MGKKPDKPEEAETTEGIWAALKRVHLQLKAGNDLSLQELDRQIRDRVRKRQPAHKRDTDRDPQKLAANPDLQRLDALMRQRVRKAPTEPPSVRADKRKELRQSMSRARRVALFKAMIEVGDVDGVYEYAIKMLRRRDWHDPELLGVLARVLSRKVRTGVNGRFTKRRGRQPGDENPVECRVLTGKGRRRQRELVSRREIAIAVLTRLPEPEDRHELIDRTGFMSVVGEVATLYGIGEGAVRGCFEQHWRQLALQRVFGAPAEW